jgi:hypothetical protein
MYSLMVGGSCNTLEESRNANAMNTVLAKVRFFKNKKRHRKLSEVTTVFIWDLEFVSSISLLHRK